MATPSRPLSPHLQIYRWQISNTLSILNRITGIINGQRSITADTALRLGHWFGTSAEFWLNLQTLYELRLARQETGARVARLPTRAGQTSPARATLSPGR